MKKIVWAFLIVTYLIPILLYAYTFGVGVWKEHQSWSEMGSALGGIYSPLVAFTTLLLLYRQQSFHEDSHKKSEETDFKRHAFSKCESYITMASAQVSKLTESEQALLQEAFEAYVKESSEEERYKLFHGIDVKFRAQVASLTRVGTTIHHMKKSDVDLRGQISDLRVYASSLIDLDLLLAHDEFHRAFTGDKTYYSFELSQEEEAYYEREMEKLRSRQEYC
ncbi:hypothetical protein [Vibrio owensii]|uniref:hypothetical protein n=2 Tax=Vibrio harveyi group TaxID=717610 RepID=UPI0038CF2445